MMTVLAAAAAYLAGAYHLARMAWAPEYARGPGLLMGTIGALIHLAVHADTWRLSGGPDLSFLSALSWVALGMAALTLLASHRQRLEALGVVVFPLAALALLGHSLDSAGTTSTERLDWGIELHALLALLAYATLALAALLAIMLWLQERALRQRRFTTALRALPPLTQLEMLLFRTLAAAFAVLTLALITGLTFVHDLLAQHLAHKTVLSLLSWLVLAGLLLGRWRYGWRGRRAVKLTLTAMVLLALAFFGSKFVLEILLRRT
ncbi:MAG TPA: hypothetical protein DDZ76_10785 [Xanthomonadales bacterium]|nr:hypothetical protein [Xanthomonadales bacterium]